MNLEFGSPPFRQSHPLALVSRARLVERGSTAEIIPLGTVALFSSGLFLGWHFKMRYNLFGRN